MVRSTSTDQTSKGASGATAPGEKQEVPLTRREVLRGISGLCAGAWIGLRDAEAASAPGLSLGDKRGWLTRNASPLLAWRYDGESAWRVSRPHEIVEVGSAAAPEYRARFDVAELELSTRADDGNVWRIAGRLKHRGTRAVELARVHYLDGTLADSVQGLLASQSLVGARFMPPGKACDPLNKALDQMWGQWKVRWTRAADPIYDAPDWALTRDTGVFTRAARDHGWGAGFVGPGEAFGEVGLRTKGELGHFFIGVVLDGVLFEPGESRELESALIWRGDWQAGFQTWARACAREFNVAPPKPSMVGYCSWYQLARNVTPADMQRANREFADWPVPPGGRVIQIDDGYQVMPGDWRPNDRFAGIWADLPKQIAERGSVPGSYLAPTTIHETHPLVAAHPELIQRLPNGEPAVEFPNWGGRTFFVEMDRPEARDFIRAPFEMQRKQGWKYLKIDFVYGFSTARRPFDRKLTTFQSLRRLHALMREAAGPDMLLSACVGETARYALGHVDVARLGGDTGSNWPAVRENLLQVLIYGATNGVWWQADPDVFYMRQEKTKLTPSESFVLTGSLGLLGGLFLTSDFPSQWSEAARADVAEFWTSAGPQVPVDQRLVFDDDSSIRAYRVTHRSGGCRIGIYNWADDARDVRVSLAEAGLGGAKWQQKETRLGAGVNLSNAELRSRAQPPHSLRIVDLSPS